MWSGFWYQGEVNLDGVPDGRGVLIEDETEGEKLSIGYSRDGKKHGRAVVMAKDDGRFCR